MPGAPGKRSLSSSNRNSNRNDRSNTNGSGTTNTEAEGESGRDSAMTPGGTTDEPNMARLWNPLQLLHILVARTQGQHTEPSSIVP